MFEVIVIMTVVILLNTTFYFIIIIITIKAILRHNLSLPFYRGSREDQSPNVCKRGPCSETFVTVAVT